MIKHRTQLVRMEELTRAIASPSSGVTVTACGIASASCPNMFLQTSQNSTVKRYFQREMNRQWNMIMNIQFLTLPPLQQVHLSAVGSQPDVPESTEPAAGFAFPALGALATAKRMKQS